MIEVTLKSGNKLQLDLERPDLTQHFVDTYNQGHSALWECPWCGGEIDNVCYDFDTDPHEDTWTCDDCELMITFYTPAEYSEYHQVMDGEWTILVEPTYGTWETPEEIQRDLPK